MKQVANLPPQEMDSDALNEPAMHYIADENTTGVTVPKAYARIDKISPENFRRSLGQLMYIFPMIGNADIAIVAPLIGTKGTFGNNLTTTVTGRDLIEVYDVLKVRLFIFAISISALTSVAFANLAFNDITVTPKVLGPVSLAIRDSKHVPVPAGIGTLDKLKLSRGHCVVAKLVP